MSIFNLQWMNEREEGPLDFKIYYREGLFFENQIKAEKILLLLFLKNNKFAIIITVIICNEWIYVIYFDCILQD